MIRSNGNVSAGRIPDALLTELKGSQICGRFSDKRTNAVPPICSFVSSEVSRDYILSAPILYMIMRAL